MQITLEMLMDYQTRNFAYKHKYYGIDRSFIAPCILSANTGSLQSDFLHVSNDIALSEKLADENKSISIMCFMPNDNMEWHFEEHSNIVYVFGEESFANGFNRLQNLFLQLDDWIIQLSNAVAQQKGFQSFFDISEKFIGNPVILMDPSFRTIAFMQNIETNIPFYSESIILGYHPNKNIKVFQSHHLLERMIGSYNETKRPVIIDAGEFPPYTYNIVMYPILIGNGQYYHITMVCSLRKCSEALLQQFVIFASYLKQICDQLAKSVPNQEFYHEHFFTEILDKKLVSEKSIEERAALFQVQPKGIFYLALLQFEDSDYAAANTVQKMISHKIGNTRPFIYRGSIVVLFERYLTPKQDIFPTLSIEESLETISKQYQCFIGISNVFYHLLDMTDRYVQAKAAIACGRILSAKAPLSVAVIQDPPATRIFNYRKYVAYHMIMETGKSVYMREFCQPELLNILTIDSKNQTDNYKLLYVYLQNDRKATETARIMHMHRNNVLYRIGRIEEMFGLDLNDADTRFSLLLSYAVLNIYNRTQ